MDLGSVVVVPCADIVQGKSQSDCGTVAPNTTRAWARPKFHANTEISRFMPTSKHSTSDASSAESATAMIAARGGPLVGCCPHNGKAPRHKGRGARRSEDP
jgi:hypothetical protein